VLLEHVPSKHRFGMFAGKLYWEHGQEDRRAAEAKKVRAWMNEVMSSGEAAGVHTRILGSDFNDTIGSGPYDVFASYDDGDAEKKTIPGKNPDWFFAFGRRIDYLFWANSAAGASRHGFVTPQSDGRLGRSEYFGSDHRFVYGDALIL
jgi:hypothetical protein